MGCNENVESMIWLEVIVITTAALLGLAKGILMAVVFLAAVKYLYKD